MNVSSKIISNPEIERLKKIVIGKVAITPRISIFSLTLFLANYVMMKLFQAIISKCSSRYLKFIYIVFALWKLNSIVFMVS